MPSVFLFPPGRECQTVENIKLLIIDDDPDQRDLLREALDDHFGHDSTSSVDGRQSALKLDLNAFDLILMDYNLADCSGMDLMAEVHGLCSTPVIMVTGENVGQTAIAAITRGATDYVVKTVDYLVTIPLVIRKNLMVARMKRELEEKNKQLSELLEQVEKAAATDPLTGLYNRRHFSRVLDQLFADAHRNGHDLSCIMLDLDKYKQLNDTFGHQMGDELLVCAGKVITANLRRMDVAARYGGDEFVLLMPHTSCEEAAFAVERIREEFREGTAKLLNREGMHMSVGVSSHFKNRPASADQLVALADRALYEAKDAGRDRVVLAASIAA